MAKHNVDLVLAATAITENLTLVSNDSLFRDLAAIDPRLSVEDWTT
jgi:predicted nucleic acid-binding protein